MGIKKWFLLVTLSYTTISLASNQRDSISIDPRWNEWHVNAISETGDWVFLYQNFPNSFRKNKAFAVHTDTKKRVEVTGISQPQFTSNKFLIGTRSLETIEVDLVTNQRTTLGILSQRDWVEERQILCYINDEKELNLRSYAKSGNKIVLTQKGVANYVLNPSKTTLLYQRDDSTQLYLLDLKTLKEKKLLALQQPLAAVTWNIQDNAIAVSLKDNNILFVDLETKESRVIELPKSVYPIAEWNLSFFANNDLYISYKILNAAKDPVEDYLDIWNGNDRDLKNKVRPRKKGELKGYVYKQVTKELVELLRSEKQEYLNIGISNCLLVYEPLELQDYSQAYENVRYRLLNLETREEEGNLTTAASFENLYNRSPDGKYLLYPNEEVWEVYEVASGKKMMLNHKDKFSRPVWTEDSKFIFYHNDRNLIKMDVKSHSYKEITALKGNHSFKFINIQIVKNSLWIDTTKPFLFTIKHKMNKTSLCYFNNGKLTEIINSSRNKLNLDYIHKGVCFDGKTVVWIEENYDQPHTVKVFRKDKLSTLIEPEVPEELYNWRKQKVIHYKDKYGVDLTGVLWYPKDFNPDKKYPMVTFVYDLGQSKYRSVFDIPTFYNPSGFNRALLNEQGYFVFQADTYVSEEGPGISAVECITKGVEAITDVEPTINKTKIGLIGFSFGGYKTSFILGNSKLFAAGVSGAGAHDLINWNYEYNYYRKMPNWMMLETYQYGMKEPFGANPSKYYNNSPIHFAQNFETPILLWTGLKDDNVTWENTRHMYIALKRYKKPVIALFYKIEGHGLWESRKEFTLRVFDWFDYYLKDRKEIEWIKRGTE